MKKYLLLLLALTGTVLLFAQVPQGIPYQAVARNGQGQPLDSQLVKVRFSILDSTATGTAVYAETHTTTTNSLGLFALNIGMGTPVTGTFSSINWGVNSKFLKVELDTTGTGSNYVELGTQQMMSVPYALYAGNINSSNSITSVSRISMISNPSPRITYDPNGFFAYSFQMALEYCRQLNENGYSDWRLPSYYELIEFISLNGYQNIETIWTTTFGPNGHILLRKSVFLPGTGRAFDSTPDDWPPSNSVINCVR